MKSYCTTFIILCGFFVSLAYGQEDNVRNALLSSYISPINGIVLKITETNIPQEYLKKAIKTGEEIDMGINPMPYMLYMTPDGLHLRNIIPQASFHRDIYVQNNSLYTMNSKNPQFLDIYNLKSERAESMLYIVNILNRIFIPQKTFKDILSKSPDIHETLNSYIIIFEEDGKTFLVEFDKALKIPVKKEYYTSNGSIKGRLLLAKTDKGFNLNYTSFFEDGDAFFEIIFDIEFLKDSNFDKKFIPENFGYRSVTDYRGVNIRSYSAFDKLPSEDFINALFKNPDDVVRYNTEIHRLAHPHEFEEE